MPSKTPKFDAALDEYFSKLELDGKGGQWRACRFSGENFYVRPEDVAFYKKMRVPLPTLSPNERLRRKLASFNSYELFRGISAFSGKSIVSAYPPNTKLKIFEHQAWFGDSWNPLEYGRNFDGGKSFFTQFADLQKEVPRPNLFTDTSNINSDYTNASVRLKNSFLAFDALNGENLYYFVCCFDNRDCVDCDSMNESEICYEALKGTKLYKCFFCELCEGCIESYFLFDCRNCTNCFGGVNLRNKKYVFFGEQLTKKDYEKRVASINLGDLEVLEEYKKRFNELKKKAIHPALHLKNAANSVGETVENCRDCYFVYYLYESEHVAYSLGGYGYKDSYDVVGGTYAEKCYEVITVSTEHIFNIKFSAFINESTGLEYCDLLRNCHDCFGSIGLRNRSFCIFNKQYEEDEYWKIVDEIKAKMLEDGKYGEFFPPSLLPLPYNVSYASYYRGFDDIETAKKYGYRIETIDPPKDVSGDTILPEDLPRDIKDVDDSILDKIIFDKGNGKKYRITPYELSFYRKYNLPLPRQHPDLRIKRRTNYWYLKMQFNDLICPKCQKKVLSYFDPKGPETVYCIDCYHRKII